MINKKFLYIILGCLIFVAIGLYLFLSENKNNQQTNKKQNEQTPTPIDIKTDVIPNANVQNVKKFNLIAEEGLIEFNPENLPTTLPSYKYKEANLTTRQNINNLVTYFELQTPIERYSPVQGNVIIATGNNASLVAELDNHIITLGFTNSIESIETFENLDPQKFVSTAKGILTQLGVNVNKYPDVSYAYVNYKQVRWEVVNYPEFANRIQIIFESSTPNDYPLVDKNFSLTPNQIKVTLDSQQNITQIYIEDYGEIDETDEIVTIKSKERLLEDLNANKAKIINLNALGSSETEITITVRKINFSYIKEKDNLTPTFVVIGNARLGDPNSSATSSEIELLLPADVTN